MRVKGPKVVLIGAGSMFFGRQFVWAMAHSEALSKGTMALVDIDPKKLDTMMKAGRMVIESVNSPVKLEGSTNYLDVIRGADFVVLSFSNEGVQYRGVDCRIAEKYGIRMCSGDTIGPGGIFKAMRELPVILKIAKDIEKICPDAWVINYINPTAVNGLGLLRHSKVKSFALCDSLRLPHLKNQYLSLLSREEWDISKLDLKIAGVNHFTWLLSATYEGKNIEGLLRQKLLELAATETDQETSKRKYNCNYSAILWELFGYYPACTAHTKEYLPFWQGKGRLEDKPAPLSVFDAEERAGQQAGMWHEMDEYITGKKKIEEFNAKYSTDLVTDIIETMWADTKQPFYVNCPNNGAVSNLPSDAFLELLCDINMNGPVPRPVGNFPVGLRGLQMQVMDTHELTVEAIVGHDRALLRRAFMTDPIVNSISDADAIISELFIEEKDALPAAWYR